MKQKDNEKMVNQEDSLNHSIIVNQTIVNFTLQQQQQKYLSKINLLQKQQKLHKILSKINQDIQAKRIFFQIWQTNVSFDSRRITEFQQFLNIQIQEKEALENEIQEQQIINNQSIQNEQIYLKKKNNIGFNDLQNFQNKISDDLESYGINNVSEFNPSRQRNKQKQKVDIAYDYLQFCNSLNHELKEKIGIYQKKHLINQIQQEKNLKELQEQIQSTQHNKGPEIFQKQISLYKSEINQNE